MTSLLEHDVHGMPLLVLLLLSAPATALLSRRPLRLVGFGGAMVFSLDAAVLAFTLWVCVLVMGVGSDQLPLLGLGVAAWTAWLVGYAASEALYSGRRAAVRLYNVALSALAGALFVAAGLAVRSWVALGSTDITPDRSGPWDLAAVVVGSVAYVLTDLLLSALWVARVEGGTVRAALADPAGLIGGATVLAVNATAVLAAILLVRQPWSLLLLVPVATALVHATRTGTVALTEHARAGALYRAAAGCQQASSREEVVAAVVAAAGEATAAPVVLSPAPPAPDQVGCRVAEADAGTWLVVGPRANRHAFTDGDRTAVATLAALCEQSLARIGALDRLTWVAEHDTLTGVLNRGAFLAAAARSLTPSTAVLFCDVDRFKSVNDTHGHRAGDQVLAAVTHGLREVVGDRGTVGRLGGDELVVLLPSSSPGTPDLLRSAILGSEHLDVELPSARLRVELSIGVATVADLGPRAHELAPDDLAEALLERADARMYADKRAGRHQPVP